MLNKVVLKIPFGLCENAWDCAYKIARISAATYPIKSEYNQETPQSQTANPPKARQPYTAKLGTKLKLRHRPFINLSNMQNRYA